MTNIQEALQNYKVQYDRLMKEDINIDMTRGKPSEEQLALSFDLLDVIKTKMLITIYHTLTTVFLAAFQKLKHYLPIYSMYLKTKSISVVIQA